MKNYFAFLLLPLILLFACQEESSSITDEEEVENISGSMVNLLANMSSNDGSIDNILDSASCLEIALPITVIVNGIEINVTTHNDLQIVEAIIDDSVGDIDTIELVFPITLILADFTTIDINNEQELLSYSMSCDEDNVQDQDIECLDFVYPITFSIFNINATTVDTVNIVNDEQLYEFITSISDATVVSLNYPLQVILWDDSILTINSQNELEIALEVAQDACDEDDDTDFDDDDNINIDQDQFVLRLTDCLWEIETLVLDNINYTSDLVDSYLDFNENFTVSVVTDGSNQTGTWSIEPEGESFRVTIDSIGVPGFENDWLLHTIEEDDGYLLDLRNTIDILRIQENCNIEDTDAGITYTSEEVVEALETCEWVLDLDQNGDYFFYDFTFNTNETILVANLLTGQNTSGNWNLSQDPTGTFMISLSNLSAELSALNQVWTIQDFASDFITLENEQGNILTMSQTCPNDLDLTEVLLDSNWRITYFDLNGENQTALFTSFIFDFDAADQVIAIEDGVDGFLGSWQALNNDLGLSLDFGPIYPLFNLNSDYWIVLDLQSTKVELVYQNGQDLFVAVFQSN